jgi:hypothetical protein
VETNVTFGLRLAATFAAVALVAPPASLSAQHSAAPDTTAGAVVSGDVYDSVDVAPIGDAMVQMVSQSNTAVSFTTTSDSAGHYQIAHVPPGKYILGFLDETLSELGLSAVERTLEVGSAAVDNVRLATPGSEAMHNKICGRPADGDSSSVMVGFVRDAGSGTPLGLSTVIASWNHIVLDDRGVHNDRRAVPAKTAPSGWFAVCGLPSDRPLEARAELGSRATGFIEVRLPRRGVLVRDFDLGSDTVLAVNREKNASPLGESLRHGAARLVGTVADSTGRLLAGAHVTLWGSSTAITGADGQFHLDSLPSGTGTLESQYLGFELVRRVVDLAAGRTDTVRVTMSKSVQVLAAVKVESKAGLMRYQAFNDRRKNGLGHYYTAEDIAKSRPLTLMDFFYMVPGVRVVPVSGADYELLSTHGSGLTDLCGPAVWINDTQLHEGGLNQLVRPEDVTGIEIYDASNAPPRYNIGQCGAIIIWTR